MTTRRTHAQYAADLVATLDKARVRRLMTALRRWFRAHGRDLPWRRTRDPYHVLVSELMLQQTQVSRVIDYYERWLARFPSLHDVARARPSQVREAWEGLGYYARVRNLQQLARTIAPNGEPNHALPSEPAQLRALPGIGDYTAGAVASFAYEKRAPLVDTNVARVLLRLFAPEHSPKSGLGQKIAWALAEFVLPRTGKATWTHNQAIMELGALVCTARIAKCAECPLAAGCATATTAARESAPRPSGKAEPRSPMKKRHRPSG
jgi:A/G-specific adenine glycosylase